MKMKKKMMIKKRVYKESLERINDDRLSLEDTDRGIFLPILSLQINQIEQFNFSTCNKMSKLLLVINNIIIIIIILKAFVFLGQFVCHLWGYQLCKQTREEEDKRKKNCKTAVILHIFKVHKNCLFFILIKGNELKVIIMQKVHYLQNLPSKLLHVCQ